MTRISIKDLTESVALDHEAMTAISGGARIARRQPLSPQTGAPRVTQFPWEVGIAAPQSRRAKPGGSSKQ